MYETGMYDRVGPRVRTSRALTALQPESIIRLLESPVYVLGYAIYDRHVEVHYYYYKNSCTRRSPSFHFSSIFSFSILFSIIFHSRARAD